MAGRAALGLIFILVISSCRRGCSAACAPQGAADKQDQGQALREKNRLTPSSAILVVRGVSKAFKGVQALAKVELEVRGEIRPGPPNGSGKSTLINLVSGHYPADGGSIRFEGRELVGESPHRIARAGIARTYQIRAFPHLTVLENGGAAMFGQVVMDRARPRPRRGDGWNLRVWRRGASPSRT